MSKLYFCNDGDFNIKAFVTFGVSAKNTDDALGFFGTGFKYAVAIILRLGGTIKIVAHGEEYEFTMERESFREKEFDIVHLNGENAGFTTHIGVNWKPWMAFRELYSNCKDEGGSCTETRQETDVVIEVDCKEIYDAYQNIDDYFITTPATKSLCGVDIHDEPRPYIFYRGVAVRDMPKKSLYCYNIITPIDLTEDRTAKYDFQWYDPIITAIQSSDDVRLMRKVLTADHDTFEGGLEFNYHRGFVDEFIQLCRELIASGIGINDSARSLLKKVDEKAGSWPEVYLTKVQLNSLNSARDFLINHVNINIDKFPVKVVDGLGAGVMGRALDGVIFLSIIPFNLGKKQVASTLLEEWVHNEYGCEDLDRNMQSWLFDKILSIGEELAGEPL